ncbi:uncharacterized protein [Prorops nasuta]|uniref:uncharacterized protein n=1 Tax=Prorops nasuta TaxID=863751 RepID=UPI0034CECACA
MWGFKSIVYVCVLLATIFAMSKSTEARSLRRHGHRQSSRNLEASADLEDQASVEKLVARHRDRDLELREERRSLHGHQVKSMQEGGPRRKRHNKHSSNVSQKMMTAQDAKAAQEFMRAQQAQEAAKLTLDPGIYGKIVEDYQLEVKEAQNSSICNYTVVPIPNVRGRNPRDLEHVICNHAGSRCQSLGQYCCIQTYREIEVTYGDKSSEVLRIYAGCVCALQLIEMDTLSLDD